MTALLTRHLQVGEQNETSSLYASGLAADCSQCKLRHRSLAFTEAHEKQGVVSAPSLHLLVLTSGLDMAGTPPSKDMLFKDCRSGNLDISDLQLCQWQGRRTQRTAVHTELCPCDLVTTGCGWSKHNVQGTEVRTWANRNEVVSETTKQIFACNALRQITERQPTKGGGVWRRQGLACLLSSAKDIMQNQSHSGLSRSCKR